MNIICHMPSDKRNINELSKILAKIQAEAVMVHIANLDLPPKSKITLLDNLINQRKNAKKDVQL